MRPLLSKLLPLLVLALPACKQTEPAEPSPPVLAGDRIDPVALQTALLGFSDQAVASVVGTAGDVAANTVDRRVRERALAWKIRVVPTLRASVVDQDPRRAFLRTWALIALSEENMSTGGASKDFGDQQPLVLATLADLKARIKELGLRFFSPETIAATEKQVEEVADALAAKGAAGHQSNLVVTSLEAMGGGVRSILSLPLKPFTSIDNTAAAVNNVARIGEAFQRTVEQLPEVVRWQTELLLLELDTRPTVVAARESLVSAAASLERVSETTAALPDDLRRELAAAQGELRLTLDRVDATLAGTNEALSSATGTAEELTRTAEALKLAADAVLPVVESIRALTEPPEGVQPEPDPDAHPFDITEYTATAQAIEAAAARVDGILARAESEESRETLSLAAEEMGALIDRAAWRLLIVVGALIAGLALLRLWRPRRA